MLFIFDLTILIDRRFLTQIRAHDGREEQRSKRRDGESADHSAALRSVLLAAFTQAQGHWQHADDHRDMSLGEMDQTEVYDRQ